MLYCYKNNNSEIKKKNSAIKILAPMCKLPNEEFERNVKKKYRIFMNKYDETTRSDNIKEGERESMVRYGILDLL